LQNLSRGAHERGALDASVGADASVSMMKVGANAQVDSATSQQAVIGYVLTKGGLMANLSLEGTKISPIDL